jgi:hypothetical protein
MLMPWCTYVDFFYFLILSDRAQLLNNFSIDDEDEFYNSA